MASLDWSQRPAGERGRQQRRMGFWRHAYAGRDGFENLEVGASIEEIIEQYDAA